MQVLAAVTRRDAIEKILTHKSLPTTAPTWHRARPPPQMTFGEVGGGVENEDSWGA